MRATVLAAVVVLAALTACNPQPPKSKLHPAATPRPHATATPLVLEITGHGTATRPVHVIQQVHNRVDYDLLASSYESRGPEGSTRAVFADARVTFRDVKGSTIRATAPQAVVDQTSNSVTLLGGVAARTASGATLHCTQLVYDRRSGLLHGNGDVVITDPNGFRATGQTFDSDLSLSHVRMR